MFKIFIFYSYLVICYITMNAAVCIIRSYLSRQKTSYVISYHKILCHVLYVMTIVASLAHSMAAENNGQLKQFVNSYGKFTKAHKRQQNISPNYARLSTYKNTQLHERARNHL